MSTATLKRFVNADGDISMSTKGAVTQADRHSRTRMRKRMFSAVKSLVAAKWRSGAGLTDRAFRSDAMVLILVSGSGATAITGRTTDIEVFGVNFPSELWYDWSETWLCSSHARNKDIVFRSCRFDCQCSKTGKKMVTN